MMDLPKPVRDNITEVREEGKAFIFISERGKLRIAFKNERLVNISFLPGGSFPKKKPWILRDDNISAVLSEDNAYYYLSSDSLTVCILKEKGAVKFLERESGRQIFAEDESIPRQFEEVREYITVFDDDTKVDVINTADGEKKVITSSNKLEGRLLYKSRLHFKFDEEEAIYGLGQSEEGILNHRGHITYLNQGNRKIAIPVFISDKGYGMYFPTGSAAIFCDNEEGSFFQTEASEMMEYYFLGGKEIDESIALFRFLTGKAEMLPLWAYGYLQSKERYESEEELLNIGEEFRKRDIGLDALILDWITWEDNMWGQKTLDPKRFPTPDLLTKKLHEKNIHLMISIWPNMTKECDNHKEFMDCGLLFPGTNIYDALKKEARELYWKQVNEGLYVHGIDGFWCDSSEPITPEWIRSMKPDNAYAYFDFIKNAYESMPYDEINAYGFYHALGIFEGQRKTSNKRVMNLTRNGYPGSQRFGAVLWSGDIAASFDTLKKQIVEGLNFSASGLPYWTLDIGAFFVKRGAPWYWEGHYPEGLDNLGYRELYVRWYQYGAFLPVFRSHGTDCPREPWRFGEPGDMFYDAIIRANELRYKLLPYIYSVAYKVWRDDYTMMRLLAFDYPKDKNVKEITDQYMFGPLIMVCPVINEMYYNEQSQPVDAKKTRRVYFPYGNDWIDIRDQKKYRGGSYEEVSADIYSIPVFVKEGSRIPICKNIKSAMEMPDSEITYESFGEKIIYDFELYMDSGDSYDYQNS